MRLRRQKKQRESSIDDLLPQFAEDGHRANPGPAWVACAEAQLVREESNRMIRRAIDRLPDAYRTVLMLRDIEDLDGSETAAALGTTPNAVKVRLHRARMALRTLLEPMMTGERVREDR
jgi:RNA polymerase sigma-70 factor (ECF subfamily)